MPYVRIEITDGATYEQKLQIYKETTEMLVRILNKKPEYTFVVIEEVDNKNWGHMGTSVAKIREAEAKEREMAQSGAGKAAAIAKPSKVAKLKPVKSKPKAKAKRA
jgi:4-oxalocrotonate tautomerase